MVLENIASEIESLDLEGLIKMEDAKMQIPVVRGQPLRDGIETVCGSMPAKILAYKHKVDFRDALRKTGYQRRPQTSRISPFKTDLRNDVVDIPTAILLNIRGRDAGKVLLEDPDGQLSLMLDLEDEDLTLHVVDGQHRVLALVQLCEEDLERWGNFMLQFVLMLGADLEQEMRQ